MSRFVGKMVPIDLLDKRLPIINKAKYDKTVYAFIIALALPVLVQSSIPRNVLAET